MTCLQCAALARQLADLQSEVDAWRALDADQGRAREDAERLHRWSRAMKVRPTVGRTVLALVDAAPRAISVDRIGALGGGDGDFDALAKVNVWYCRRAIALLGLDRQGIEAVRGYGYSMTRELADALTAIVESAQ